MPLCGHWLRFASGLSSGALARHAESEAVARRAKSEGPARRARRYPPGAHGRAVGAAHRLHCDARSGVAAQNSLRSLRSLRSNSCAESVYEARCARRLRSCASRRPANRLRRAPPAATVLLFRGALQKRQQRRARAGCGAPAERRVGEHGHKRSRGPLVPCERPGLLARRGLQGQDAWPRASARFVD